MLGQETNCDNADLDLIFTQSNWIGQFELSTTLVLLKP